MTDKTRNCICLEKIKQIQNDACSNDPNTINSIETTTIKTDNTVSGRMHGFFLLFFMKYYYCMVYNSFSDIIKPSIFNQDYDDGTESN